MPRIVKISTQGECIPCTTRLTEAECTDLLRGKSVLITSTHRLKGGALKKNQEFVDLYLPSAMIESCKKSGNDWVVKVKFPDPDQDPTVLHYLDDSTDIRGKSIFKKIWRGIKKVGRFVGKIGKKIAPAVWAVAKPVLGSLAKEAVGSVPGLSTLIESGKQVASQIPGGASAVSAIEGGVGKVLGSGMSKSAAERRANAVLKLLKPVLIQSYMDGGRIQAV